MGLNEPESIRGRSNENDDTMISSGVNKSMLNKQSKVRESEDEFDKIIGHIEGSKNKETSKAALNPIKDDDLEDEDFF